MTERDPRIQWTESERKKLHLAGKGLALLFFLIGCGMAYYGFGIAQYGGVGIAAIGAWNLFPSTRPLLKAILDKLPSFGKPKDSPGQLTQQIEALEDDERP